MLVINKKFLFTVISVNDLRKERLCWSI